MSLARAGANQSAYGRGGRAGVGAPGGAIVFVGAFLPLDSRRLGLARVVRQNERGSRLRRAGRPRGAGRGVGGDKPERARV